MTKDADLVPLRMLDGKGRVRVVMVPKEERDSRRREIRAKRAAEVKRHADQVRHEVNRRHLDDIDPSWRDRFTQDAAELFYFREIEARKPR